MVTVSAAVFLTLRVRAIISTTRMHDRQVPIAAVKISLSRISLRRKDVLMVIIASFRAAGVSVPTPIGCPRVGASFDSLDLLARKALSDLPD
jgi:hypothetical protein